MVIARGPIRGPAKNGVRKPGPSIPPRKAGIGFPLRKGTDECAANGANIGLLRLKFGTVGRIVILLAAKLPVKAELATKLPRADILKELSGRAAAPKKALLPSRAKKAWLES